MKKRTSKKYQSVITARIRQSVRKATAAFLVLFVCAGVVQVRGTNAGFSDAEESTDNIFTTTSLDAKMSYVDYFSVTGMKPTKKPDGHLTFANEGSLDFRYSVEYRQIGDDATLCDALILTAKHNGETVYDESLLKDFSLEEYGGDPFEISAFHEDEWDFTVELPADAGSVLENKACTWAFDTVSWQITLPDATAGFTDTETTETATHTNSIETGEWLTPGDVVINEVMWMGSTVNSHDEWIELKNMTGKALSLEGWKIENASSAGGGVLTIPSGKSIPANGYFLIVNNDKTDSASALNVAPDWVTTSVEFNNDHNGDVILKTATGVIIDSALAVTNWPAGSNGALKQSMERNDIPGDGLLALSWHTCVSGAANSTPYWDVTGSNFGTPKAANLSPIVLNEFVLNPVGDDAADQPDGEWVELYNILATDINVAGWYLKNSDGDVVTIADTNTTSGDTVVPGQGRLVVYLERALLDNDADTLSLYAPGILSADESDDVREDTFSYTDASVLPEGKSYARFPDGEGIWIDPVPTPGEENELDQQEKEDFQILAFETCFEDEKLKKKNEETICSPLFLTYLSMLEERDDTKISDEVILGILTLIEEKEAKRLAALLEETPVPVPVEPVDAGDVPDEPVPGEGTVPDVPVLPEMPAEPLAGDIPMVVEPAPAETPPEEEIVPKAEEEPAPKAKEETVPEEAPLPANAPSN